ncbi:exonuclease SbcCD subunit D [Microbacterium oryzae]|uniref:Nuclease SbcCD subunit D n=1 Tax=Microbacterium oryzae TaxID=743009 RepID=A0A6I6DTT8_9MICO|nr:exonuclease SbcCD subunit D [Microbacterium oryzae]QGU28405.1 exonuclease SbcCD subunit D [Microbacterium oryzae]
MRILHTSDWHIGRTFHGFSTLDALRDVFGALVDEVRARNVDVVVVAGDVFDSGTPAAAAFELLTDTLRAIREAGAQIVVTSGNHDSAARLGFQAPLLGVAGVHIVTDPRSVGAPITIEDEHGPVHFYGLPYLEPAIVRTVWPEVDLRTQEQAIRHAMSLVNADRAERGGRSIVASHCFAGDVEPTAGVEREIRQGALDVVPLVDFEGPDYVALGHIHGRSRLAENVRYSGAPLHYSFGEGDKPRGAWIVDLGAEVVERIEWLDLPIPRRLVTLRGTLDELLTDERFAEYEEAWVCAMLTDVNPPLEPMRKLRARFDGCATIQLAPAGGVKTDGRTFRERVENARSDGDLVQDFLAHVRNGESATDAEREIIGEVVSIHAAAETRA